MGVRLERDSRARRISIVAALYLLTVAVYLAFAARSTLLAHTPYNHFALLAEAWLSGRLDLGGAPPAYAGNNDFALFEGRWYVAFPPFPALLLTPLVAFAGAAADVRDGQFFIWLSGIAPAVSFLVLEKLRRDGRANTTEVVNLVLAATLAFGTVYFFSAVQGTVWFAAHVVAAGLMALYLLFALGAERPLLAGLMLAFGVLTRPPLVFAAPLFVYELLRVGAGPGARLEGFGRSELRRLWSSLDHGRLWRGLAWFALPLAAGLVATALYNAARFGDPFDSGYRFLTVRWQGRIEKWGLFHYHYLARNLGVVLTSLPWVNTGAVPFRINGHGLALWFTTPLFLWLLWPRRRSGLWVALSVTTALVALPTLFYQNTGWVQFGYRFSNDYAVLLIVLLAVGGYRFRYLFGAALVWSVAVNAFGAATFGRADYAEFYVIEPTQRVLYQAD